MPLFHSFVSSVALRSVALLLVAVSCLNARSAPQKTPAKAKTCQLSEDDYAVYSALVEALGVPEHPEDASKRNAILIANTTAAPRDVRSHFGTWGYRSKSKTAPSKDTVVAFERNAQSSCLLNSQFGDAKHYKVITREELDKAFKGGGWQDFYKEYPESGGYWIFSRPGYNSARNEAVFSVSHGCGELCGTGYLYFLAKQNGQWEIRNRLMLWIS